MPLWPAISRAPVGLDAGAERADYAHAGDDDRIGLSGHVKAPVGCSLD